jgi:hypothetical protein
MAATPTAASGDVQQFNDGRLATVRVPGRDEDYLLVIFPFEEQTERALRRVVPVPTPRARVSCAHETRAGAATGSGPTRGWQTHQRSGLDGLAGTGRRFMCT